MATKQISINPKHRKDPAQRYVMPVFVVRYQGKHQNTKTSLENLDAIAAAIHRPALTIWKFFGLEFNTRLDKSDKAGVYFLRGTYRPKDLQDKLDIFIKAFVLCAECGNPETRLRLNEEKKLIYKDCGACGYRTNVVGRRQGMMTFLVRNGAVSAEEKDEPTKKKKKKKKKKKTKTVADEADATDADDDVVWVGTVSKEAKEKRRAELLGKTARQELENLIKAKSFDDVAPFLACQKKEEWSDRRLGNEFLSLAATASIYAQLPTYSPILKAIAAKTSPNFLYGVLDAVGVASIETFPHLAKMLAGIFQKLYSEDIVGDEAFAAWHKEEKPANAEAKKAAEKFFDWLLAEDSSSEEEE